jgi:DNA topoisomerase-1
MEAYCIKCKTKRELADVQAVYLINARPATQGKCSVCGTVVTRLGRTPAHDSLPPPAVPAGEGKLVIVESPAKARTVGRFLGKGYKVKPSVGHIRDLPANHMGVDLENDFKPRYVIPAKKAQVVRDLKKDASAAAEIYLATDPDREGEAISWHLRAALSSSIRGKPVRRVVFHEITRSAIGDAFGHPSEINQELVDAQQARRILDRIVGYTLSPLLRENLGRNRLSAGRVQSVAVRLVVEREREIQAFVPEEYWSVEVELAKKPDVVKRKADARPFRAALVKVKDEKFECHKGEEALALKTDLERALYAVLDVREKEVRRNPSPPFITSTMQQEASRKMRFSPKRTMALAQQLYEGLPIGDEGSVGLITYMRTDSTNIAEVAQKEALQYIAQKFGQPFVPAKPWTYKTKAKGAQEAHEAIRPTSVFREPSALKRFLDANQYRLYELVWKRFVASQMAPALFDTMSVDISADSKVSPVGNPQATYMLRATGSRMKFPGFMQVYIESRDEGGLADGEEEKALPPLTVDEILDLLGVYPEQHFTQPPPRYTEATLVRALEEKGIGRPSTYAPILSTIQERGYVEQMEGRRLVPTEIGFIVNDLLVKHFPDVIDVGFTAAMEERLDEIASGGKNWVRVLGEFYAPFKQTVDTARNTMERVTIPVETTDQVCEKCGSPMVIKRGRFGKFLACSAFPECRNAKPITVPTGAKCPECGGDILERRTRSKRIFYGCANYPECKFAVRNRPLLQPCPHCGGLLTEKPKDADHAVCQKCGEEVEAARLQPAQS